MKTYKQFINESLRDKMVGISDDDLKKRLSKLNTGQKLVKLKNIYQH